MKLFIAMISLLFGIIIGTSITVFFVLKKNPTAKKYLCQNFKEEGNDSLLQNIINTAVENQISNMRGQLKTWTTATSSPGSVNATSTMEKISGPGGCLTEDECMKYCSILDHLEECLAFAKGYINEPPLQAPNSKFPN